MVVQFLCFDRLFSALDRKVEGILKLTDCVHKRLILLIRHYLFFRVILSDMFKQSLAMLSGG